MLLAAAQQAATPQGYSIGIALLLAVWAYIGIVLNLGPGLWWQEALVAGFVTGVVVGDIPLGLSVGGTLTLLSLGLWTYGGATIPDFQTGAIVGTAVGALGGGIPSRIGGRHPDGPAHDSGGHPWPRRDDCFHSRCR